MKYLYLLIFLFLSPIVFAETNTVSSTVVTNSTPPTANAPSIINSNSDICKVGVGASVQNNIVGLASGIVIDDELCQKLKLSRSLYAYGMKVAAVSILCQDYRTWDSMTDAEFSKNVDFLSNGIKIRDTSSDLNGSADQEYIYMAFAEHPFVSSKGVPVTAR